MAENGRQKKQLTVPQVKAIAALLESSSVEAAAKTAGVGERTLRRWLNDDADFQSELRRQEGRLIDAAIRNLAQMQRSAVVAIAAALGDKSAPHSVKLRAAEIVFSNLLKMREAHTMEERIAALERALGTGESDEQAA